MGSGSRCIITYAVDAHEELLDISLPTYQAFAKQHGYDMILGKKITNMPPAWNKVHLLIETLASYEEVVWFDCDLVVVDLTEDFPKLVGDRCHSLVRHFENNSEVPNTGVWRINQYALSLLNKMLELEVFRDHGWWEQAALMTLMGYTVPPQGSEFKKTKCRCVNPTKWQRECQFMRVKYNSHPNYRAEDPVIVHCSYPSMLQRTEVMKALVKDPNFDYPRYETAEEEESES